MNKLKEINSLGDLKEFVYLHKEQLRKAALPVTVAAAVLFFWVWGSKDTTIIEEDNQSSAEVPYEEYNDGDENNQQNSSNDGNNGIIYVDISGCIDKPGVYEVEEGTRLFQLIEKAGGLTENADIEGINRAETVLDGQKIIIYAKGQDDESKNSSTGAIDSSGKININSADIEQLQQIPGVGPVTADKIIQYRQDNGRFSSIDDIKNVSGIGEKTFEKLKDYITVR